MTYIAEEDNPFWICVKHHPIIILMPISWLLLNKINVQVKLQVVKSLETQLALTIK